MINEFINYMRYSQGGKDFQVAVLYLLTVYICYLIFNFSRNCYKMIKHNYQWIDKSIKIVLKSIDFVRVSAII